MVLPFAYDSIGHLFYIDDNEKERFGIVIEDSNYGLINQNFKILATTQYDNIYLVPHLR